MRLDLAGEWRAAPADEQLRRLYPDPSFDDSAWAAVPVPGHWQSTGEFVACAGPVLFRRPFEAGAPPDGRRAWLRFDGVFYQSDVWLDGTYVGDTEGYFAPHVFEVTDALRDRAGHLLAMEVSCSPTRDLTAKRNITGVFQDWELLDPDWGPGGIWAGVTIEETGPVRIASTRVLCTDASDHSATVALHVALDAAEPTTCRLVTRIASHDHDEEHQLAAGANELAWSVTIDQPALWWPRALGDQPLHDVVVSAHVGGVESDRRRLTTGIRQVRLDHSVMSVNGERLFLKGSNYGPTRLALADVEPSEVEHDVLLAARAGLDVLRVHAHIGHPALYDAADRHGLLLWQDLPLQRSYARGIRKIAAAQARAAVELLGHHPSVALWCGHNEPDPRRGAARRQAPSWNRTVLDATVKRALERADPSRPVIPHSGVPPHVGSGGTDSHLYFGWEEGEASDLARAAARFPRIVRFVSELGAASVPSTHDFVDGERWPDLDWEGLASRHALDRDGFERNVAPSGYPTFDAWVHATQEHQASVIRTQAETLRRLKYRPTGGFCQYLFADPRPAISHSVLDHRRVAKLAYEALAAACAPVIVVADEPQAAYAPGKRVQLDVHVVSDLRVALGGARVRAEITGSGPATDRSWAWEGDVAADSVARVGRVDFVTPTTPGDLSLLLTLEHDLAKATRTYAIVVTE